MYNGFRSGAFAARRLLLKGTGEDEGEKKERSPPAGEPTHLKPSEGPIP